MSARPVVQVLGVRFFDGSAREAVEAMTREGGYLVVPAAPALVNICYDEQYRRALLEADMAIADSGMMVLLWRAFRRQKLTRVSGLAYLQALLERPESRGAGALFIVLPNQRARDYAAPWLISRGFEVPPTSLYVAPAYGSDVADAELLERITATHPRHVVVGIGGGTQERLGLYLRENLSGRPAIHCIGAALGFLTGEQKPIPAWADRLYLGWLLRLARNPRLYLRRFWIAHELPGLIAQYGSELPPMRKQGAQGRVR